MESKSEFNDRLLSLGLARVSEAAAIAATEFVGGGDEKAADQAAVDAMREQLNMLDINGTIVIGEGERDEAPMLFIGEKVGSGTGPGVDVALDPLEGTNLTAKDMPNALTVIAMATKGSLLHAPDVYMEKLAFGPGYDPNIITLDMTPAERVEKLAKAKGCKPKDLMICVLERPRHQILINEIRETGARLRLITDGDVAGIIHCAETKLTGVDMLMGLGGAPEGVLAASALKCLGGQIQGRLIFRTNDEKKRAEKAGIKDLHQIYNLRDMVTQEVIFAASGVTNGSMLKGARVINNMLETETILMRSKTGSIRRLTYRQKII